jgi:hypothetical protein
MVLVILLAFISAFVEEVLDGSLNTVVVCLGSSLPWCSSAWRVVLFCAGVGGLTLA